MIEPYSDNDRYLPRATQLQRKLAELIGEEAADLVEELVREMIADSRRENDH